MGFFTRGDPLYVAARSYAKQVRCEAAAHEVEDVVGLEAETTDWDAIFCAEGRLIGALHDSELRRRAWIIYQRYANVAGAEKAAERAAANVLDIATCDKELLRADLLAVHTETVRLYLLGFQVERERADLSRFVIYVGGGALMTFFVFISWAFFAQYVDEAWASVIVAALGICVVLAMAWYERHRARSRETTPQTIARPPSSTTLPPSATLILPVILVVVMTFGGCKAQTPPAGRATEKTAAATVAKQNSLPARMPIAPMILLTGILGACFSVLQRVQRPLSGDPLVSLLSLRSARTNIFLSIMSGAIASLVVFAIFAGGMLEGGLFPKIVNGSKVADTDMMRLVDFLANTGPRTHADYGKLMVWAFIAGFAERFVPDILDRFVATTKKQ